MLHIGWWRNGYHDYEPVAVPTEGEIRKRGASLAAAISVAWIAAGVAGAVLLRAIESDFHALPELVLIGAIAALPVATCLGWWRAPLALKPGRPYVGMALQAVLLTDMVIASALFVASSLVATNAYVIVYALIAIPYGLMIFGLPGLAMALPSAWCWQRMMRRKFYSSGPRSHGV